jgi:hypothetical protein
MGDEWFRFVGSGKVSLTMDLAAGQLTAMDDCPD